MGKNNTKNIKRDRDAKGRFVKGNSQTFKHHPERINPDGTFHPEDSIGWQYKYLIRMSVDEFEKWLKENPDKKRTIAQELAYQAVVKARKDLQYLKEVTDRTEGRAPQSVDIKSGGKPIPLFDYVNKKK